MKFDPKKYFDGVEKYTETNLTVKQAQALTEADIRAIVKDNIRIPWMLVDKLQRLAVRTARRVENETALAALELREKTNHGQAVEFALDQTDQERPILKIYPKGKPPKELNESAIEGKL